MFDDVRAYLDGRFNEVQGWCTPHLWQAIEPLRIIMGNDADGPIGPVAEIGVFHGKFFIGLVKTFGQQADNCAMDVFDLQRFNLDFAGEGNLAMLKQNLERSGVPESAVTFVRGDTLAMTDNEIHAIREKTGGFSMFSVDGCHLEEHTINDIRIAMTLTRWNGIIFVDDYYNPDWPGVQEGVARLYHNERPRFVPLFAFCGKLFLCQYSMHSTYLTLVADFIRHHHPTTALKPVKRYGYDTLTIHPDYQLQRYLSGP